MGFKEKTITPKKAVSMIQVRNKVVSVNMQVCVSWWHVLGLRHHQ